MKFIELKTGLSVRTEDIESISINPDNGGSTVIMRSGSVHETGFQFIHLLQIIDIEVNNNHEPRKETQLESQFFNG